MGPGIPTPVESAASFPRLKVMYVVVCQAGVALDNEGEVKRIKQAMRLLLLDEDDINDGRTDAEVRPQQCIADLV